MLFTSREKAFCVLGYARTNSNKTEQCAFVGKLSEKSSTTKKIWSWKKKFENKGCLCKAKGCGQPATAEGKVEQICQTLLQSPKKSIRRTTMETLIPGTTVWQVVRKHLVMKPYKLLFIQAITAADKRKCKQFCVDMQEKFEVDEFNECLVFSDEATFHTNDKVNRQNVRIWGKENPYATIEHERDSAKVNVFCAISKNHVQGPFFFEGNVWQCLSAGASKLTNG